MVKKLYLLFIPVIITLIIFLYLNAPVNNGVTKNITINKGITFHHIANILKKNRLIKSEFLFLSIVKITGSDKKLMQGYYELSDKYSTLRIIKILTRGNIATRTFTIPEGYNIYKIAKLLEKQNITSADKFLYLVKNKKIISKYKINSASLEGFLYPDTYTVPFNIRAEELIDIMVKNFFSKIDNLYIKRMKKLNYTLEYTVKLASLVEWEAKEDFERPLIASVFINRLKRNLNLGSCATVLYALGKHKKRLLFKDLKTRSEYNTYIYKGLPPTPICNPGYKSILAVLFPAKENYLYFVSMKNGRHYFSKTYSEHHKAYKKYILGINN